MGKKRIIKKGGSESGSEKSSARLPKKKIGSGILFINSTFNNTKITLTDKEGNAVLWASSGSVGFKGTKKSTPFAASKATEGLAEKAKMMGLTELDVVVKGVGSGRESAIRTVISKGIDIKSIKDATPVPHNGPRPPKPRRV